MSTLKTQTIQPPSDSDGLTFRTNQSDRVTIGADGFVSILTSLMGGITIDGGPVNATRGISVGGASSFSGGVTFSSFYVTSGATFDVSLSLVGATSSGVISCSTAPSQGQHITNKTYVDSLNRVGSVVVWASGTYVGQPTQMPQPTGWTVNFNGNAGQAYLTPPAGGNWSGALTFRNSNSQSISGPFSSIPGGSTSTISTGLVPFDNLAMVAVRVS